METQQQRILRILRAKLEGLGYVLAQQSTFANRGTVFIYIGDEATIPHGEIRYDFQSSNYTMTITVAGRKIPSQPGRNDYFDWYQAYTEPTTFWDAININFIKRPKACANHAA